MLQTPKDGPNVTSHNKAITKKGTSLDMSIVSKRQSRRVSQRHDVQNRAAPTRLMTATTHSAEGRPTRPAPFVEVGFAAEEEPEAVVEEAEPEPEVAEGDEPPVEDLQ